VVDKFIGDALMAVFGTLEEEADSEFRAVAAALEFKNAIKEMNEDRQRLGKESISIGVGLNTGNYFSFQNQVNSWLGLSEVVSV
jgi:adenylate cyclase